MPPSGPTLGALLPWPIAVTLAAVVPDSSPNESVPSLASCITSQVNSPSVSFPSEEPQPTLMTRMMNNLAARLCDPVRSIPLSSRLSDSCDLSSHLSDTPVPSLVDQLNSSESMDVENPLAIIPMAIDDPHLAAINDVMATVGPLVLDPLQYDNPWRPGDLRSLPSSGYSVWNPWNECWLRPQPISYSMDIIDSMWNDHGMINSSWIPYGMQACPPWIPWNSPYGFHGRNSIPWKFCWNSRERTLFDYKK